jgi:hypothetical protein
VDAWHNQNNSQNIPPCPMRIGTSLLLC